MNQTDAHGRTCLHYAAVCGDLAMIQVVSFASCVYKSVKKMTTSHTLKHRCSWSVGRTWTLRIRTATHPQRLRRN